MRSPEEFSGERLHMPSYPNEGALRGGHIPGAKSVPWARAINPEDGTFKSGDELRQIYQAGPSIVQQVAIRPHVVAPGGGLRGGEQFDPDPTLAFTLQQYATNCS